MFRYHVNFSYVEKADPFLNSASYGLINTMD